MERTKDDSSTLMKCCKQYICATLERESGIVFAVWTCDTCNTTMTQIIGEVDPEKAHKDGE